MTQKLLNACELPKKPMISYYEHNRRARGEAVLEKLLAGETCALVTDAGTPAVSDPGEDLVALCAEHDVPVIPIPGCCAAVCALAASGLPTGRWCFEGFLSVNKKARREHLDALKGEKRTMIFYEAPHKLCGTLRDLREAFGGERRLSLSRELTKLHEQTLRMTLDEAVAYFDENAPRGEFVLILEGAPDEPETEQDEAERLASAAEAVRRRVEQVAETLHLQGLRGKNIFSLSGGQKQLLAFGSVYAMGPEIYVLDEPTANLDQEAIARLHDQISALKRQGCTIVVAEHRLYFLTDLIDRAFYLRSGVLERVFTGEQFRSLPDPERGALGLRTLTPAVCTLPAVESAGSEEGLSVEGLTCSFRKGAPVFRDLSFSARPGEVVAITGPNGVGKTTLSRCLCGLLKEQAGQILLNGKHLDRKGRQRSAFCVMQDVNHQLFSDSVWGECRMSAPEASDDQISEVLDSLHLLPFRERHPMALSGGQKQRLAVATALLSEKPVLIFDEPTSGLDYARMVEVSEVIRSLAQHGRIVLVVTHDQEFMQKACDRVLRL